MSATNSYRHALNEIVSETGSNNGDPISEEQANKLYDLAWAMALILDGEAPGRSEPENDQAAVALAQIARMDVVPDDVVNRYTLLAAVKLARQCATGEKP